MGAVPIQSLDVKIPKLQDTSKYYYLDQKYATSKWLIYSYGSNGIYYLFNVCVCLPGLPDGFFSNQKSQFG
jgi:hypothetical protein